MAVPGVTVANFLRSAVTAHKGGSDEVVRMLMLKSKVSILDETDSGLDIDALKVVAEGINLAANENNSILLITHYQCLLDYVIPGWPLRSVRF